MVTCWATNESSSGLLQLMPLSSCWTCVGLIVGGCQLLLSRPFAMLFASICGSWSCSLCRCGRSTTKLWSWVRGCQQDLPSSIVQHKFVSSVLVSPFVLLQKNMERLRTHGTPAYGGCWADESANAMLKHLAAAAHAMVFHHRMLASWAAVGNKKKRTFKEQRANNL